MASTQFLEEALSTDVDESAVNALVGSLETQLVPPGQGTTITNDSIASSLGNNGIPNGGILVQKQSLSNDGPEDGKTLTTLQNATGTVVLGGPNVISKTGDGVKILTFPTGAQLGSPQVVNINNRVSYPQTVALANGTVSSSALSDKATALGVVKVDSGQPSGTTFVIKTPGGTVPMTAGAAQTATKPGLAPQANTVQLLNMNTIRPGVPQKTTMTQQRLVINSPQVLRPNVANASPQQFTLQTLQQLQGGGSGHILVKTETGQLQLLRVGPPQGAGASTTIAGTSTTTPFRIQPVNVPQVSTAVLVTNTTASTVSTPPALTATSAAPKQQVDTTKEKCRKFLANLLELSTREPKAVERNVRTLIQELIDAKVEPEEFCDRLEKLLNASPQPCLIGFLKKSLPLLRQSLYLRLMTIDGIRPPPHHVAGATTSVTTPLTGAHGFMHGLLQTTLRPHMVTQTVRLVAPMNAAGQTINVTTPRAPVNAIGQRIVTPIRSQPPGKLITPMRAATSTQPPPLHPTSPLTRLTPAGKVAARAGINKAQPNKTSLRPNVPILSTKSLSKAVRGGGFDSSSFGGDDDINDVAAMGGVNLAEESQRILGSTEFVGTQIRSIKDELFLHTIPLRDKVRQIVSSHGLEEPSPEVLSMISHACQERLKTLLEKLACIAEHRIDVIKLDPRYEVTQDVKGQLKFLEELDRLERKRHEELEREVLLRAAKSRSKSEDPEQVKLKAKAKEMQRAEMEELRQQEANKTALQAIGPRKKPRLDLPGSSSENVTVGGNGGQFARPQAPLRPRLKRVNLRDLLFLLEQEREPAKTKMLYRSYLK